MPGLEEAAIDLVFSMETCFGLSNRRLSLVVTQFDSGLCKLLDYLHYQDSVAVLSGIPDQIELKTSHSSLSAVNTPLGSMFLVIGNDVAIGTSHIVLISSLVSIVKVPCESTVPVPDSGLDKGQLVASIFAHIVAAQILQFLESRQTLITQNVPAVIAMALDTQAVDRDVHVVYTVDTGDNEVPASWIRLSRYILQSDVEELLYGISPCCFISFSSDEPQHLRMRTLKAAIRPHCRMLLSREIFYSPSSPAKIGQGP
ncbi:putative polyketide synthase [Seiridium cardinale]